MLPETSIRPSTPASSTTSRCSTTYSDRPLRAPCSSTWQVPRPKADTCKPESDTANEATPSTSGSPAITFHRPVPGKENKSSKARSASAPINKLSSITRDSGRTTPILSIAIYEGRSGPYWFTREPSKPINSWLTAPKPLKSTHSQEFRM